MQFVANHETLSVKSRIISANGVKFTVSCVAIKSAYCYYFFGNTLVQSGQKIEVFAGVHVLALKSGVGSQQF